LASDARYLAAWCSCGRSAVTAGTAIPVDVHGSWFVVFSTQVEDQSKMAYEVFERKTPRTGNPLMSFSRLGQITFNQPAARILQKETIETILLLWDAGEKKLAMKVTANKKDTRAYVIRFNPKGNGASFSAKTFLDHVGIDYSQRKPIPITINSNSEYFLEVAIPETCFKEEALQQLSLRSVGR
jgi:hypothetical protein